MNKKFIKITAFIVLAVTSFNMLNMFKYKTFTINNISYLTKYQYTHYYPGDPTGSGSCTGSGKCVSDFTVDSEGRYHYNHNGKDYLVVAAATTYCRDKAGHCGVNISKHGLATTIKYYHYYDTLTLPINGQMIDAIVLDSCGACMWGRQDQRGTELIDIFMSNGATPQDPKPGETDENEDVGDEADEHTTSYDGEITEGWLYLRSYAYEDPEDKYYSGPDVLDDAIDEIFYRARLIYTQHILFGPGDVYYDEDDPANDEEGDTEELEGSNEKLCKDLQDINAGGVNTWRQGGRPWSKLLIGSGENDTLSRWGCFATSIAIQIKRSGVDTGIDNFNPGTFVCEMLKHGGFDDNARINPYKISSFIPGISNGVDEKVPATQGDDAALRSRLNELMSNGHYPILWVNGSGASGHYVAVTGVTENNIKIIDPSGRGTELWPAYKKVMNIRSIKKG